MKHYIQSISSISPQHTFETDEFLSQVTDYAENPEYLPAIEPNYKDYVTDAGMRRRMSRIVKMGVAAALDCLKNSPVKNPDAIITATGLGCLTDTEKFLHTLAANDEQLLNPTSFIQSTFNTIGAQIALILKNHNYNFTYVHRGFSFESAILDAMMQLDEGEAQNVLAGAVDEITPTSFRVMKRMGFWRNGAKMGEGAQFFMLSSAPSEKDFAVLKAVSAFLLPENQPYAKTEIRLFLEKNNTMPQEIDLILLGNSGDAKQDAPFEILKQGFFGKTPSATFKQLCGEYQTASSFGLWCAANILKRQEIPSALLPNGKPEKMEKILIYNVYRNTNHSLFLLEKKE
ncbi:MAG: beta-ketoacyl synthase chain length factor [Prevotellaceae bacterium]|jgi:hypothetical protein|nr:beta-ketoacyl synthase chain length factor [Prevotellaceae bacterium]